MNCINSVVISPMLRAKHKVFVRKVLILLFGSNKKRGCHRSNVTASLNFYALFYIFDAIFVEMVGDGVVAFVVVIVGIVKWKCLVFSYSHDAFGLSGIVADRA